METQDAILRAAKIDGRDMGKEPRRSDGTTSTEPNSENSIRSSVSHWASEPGFEQIDGDIEGRGYNETTVDVVAVPCLGASPIDTWARNPLGDGYFAPSAIDPEIYSTVRELPGRSILTPTITHVLPKARHLWIRQGIRKEASQTRVMLYRHRKLKEGMTIEDAADDLIEQLAKMRSGLDKARPIFFICHSIGGLVVKAALVKAKRHEELKPLVFDCHSITFFATPHRGSSYLSMPNLRESIQNLLFLDRPLPLSITDELRLESNQLLQLHDKFMDLTSEIRIWTFYETVDSQLSGLGSSRLNEVHFSAPITSIKSGLIGSRGEKALSLESDHVHCASFGLQNRQTMHSYLRDLGEAIRQAEQLSSTYVHTPLRLSRKVKVELIGFYDDPDREATQSTRLYVSKHYLNEFLEMGPEKCLRARMNTMAPKVRRVPSRARSVSPIRTPVPASSVPLLGSTDSSPESQLPKQTIPERLSSKIVVNSHTPWKSLHTGHESESTPSGVFSSRASQHLTVPALAIPGLVQLSIRKGSEGALVNTDDVPLETPSERSQETKETYPYIDDCQPTGQSSNTEKESTDGASRRSRKTFCEPIAGFSRPSEMKKKFMWIHLPFNNPYWVKRIFDTVSESEHRDYGKLLRNNSWASQRVHGRRTNWHLSYVKSRCGFVPSDTRMSERSVGDNMLRAHFYLYLPYLHYDTYANIVRRRNIIRRRMKHGRARPVPREIGELESLEAQVIWEYIGHDPPLSTRRTLDQYGYPALQDTWTRDDDQMLYKLTKESVAYPLKRKGDTYRTGESPASAVSAVSRLASAALPDRFWKTDGTSGTKNAEENSEENVLNGNVLMVDQLWLWAVDNTTLMTFFPQRESHPIEGPLFQQADLRNSIVNELNGDLTGRCENALDLAAFITLHAVTVLLDRASHTDLEVFHIFEEAIGILTERMTSSLKAFRMESYSKVYDSDSDDPGDNGAKAIKRRHQRELERAERHNRENTSALLELRDMEDELHTLLSLFAEQRDTIKTMESSYSTSEETFTECGREFLKEALQRLEEYDRQTRDMLARVDATRKDYEKLQEMIQRQAEVDEVRWSRLQTELASSQNLSVMIFTTFTVIFLPLSFFTSLFGMNTQEWGGPDPNNFLSLTVIGTIALPVSAFLIGITLIAAFSGRIQRLIKVCYQALQGVGDRTKHHLGRIVPQSSKESAEKRQRTRDRAEKRKQRDRESAYDFWGVVRSERRSDYEIPATNRKRTVWNFPGRGGDSGEGRKGPRNQ
ncbi:hypothetical protein GGS21DRAFT_519511 [Xylaria nigripes]|nr:hypothetical protein GGS21DRAFT_519511 [Xylaria nigripes]